MKVSCRSAFELVRTLSGFLDTEELEGGYSRGMADALIVLLGSLCVLHTLCEVWALRASEGSRHPSAQGRAGEKLTLRVDRRESGRRAVDRRLRGVGSAAAATQTGWNARALSSLGGGQKKLALP